METYFITEQYLKTYTGYNNNIDMSKTDFLIKLAFDIQITELLGSYFSDFLLAKHQLVIAGTAIYNTHETKLVDLIQSTMAWQVTFESVVELSDQLTNKGSIKQTGDYQQPSGDSAMKFKGAGYKTNVESYKRKMNEYLCKNHLQFPEFMSDDNSDSLVKSNCSSCNGSLDKLEDLGMFFV